MPFLEDTADIRLGVLADDALSSLREKVQFLKNFGSGFDMQPGKADNEYFTTVISDGSLTVRERALDSDAVVDDESGSDKVGIVTSQIYTSQQFGQRFLDSTSARFTDAFIANAASKLASGIEQRGIRKITEQNSVFAGANSNSIGGVSAAITFADFQRAKLLLNNNNVREDLSWLGSHEQMQAALALTEFKNFNIVGPGGGSNVSGEAETALYGFNPQSSNLMRDGKPVAITAAINDGGDIDISQLDIAFDTQSPALAAFPITNTDDPNIIREGYLIQIDSEIMLVGSVTYSSTVAGTINIAPNGRGWAGSTAATHLDNAVITLNPAKTGLFYKGQDIISAFARQEPFNDARGIKVTAADPDNAMFLSILREPVSGFNGKWRVTISIEIGFKILRDNSVIPIILSE